MNAEEVFCSKLRMKILRLLWQLGELNVSEIARRLGVNYETTNKHLQVLEEETVIEHKVFGRIRLYRFNRDSAKAKAVQSLLSVWDQAENPEKR